jgi:hypothetical protein
MPPILQPLMSSPVLAKLPPQIQVRLRRQIMAALNCITPADAHTERPKSGFLQSLEHESVFPPVPFKKTLAV